MTDSQKERREMLIKRHEKKMKETTVEQRKEAEKKVLAFFSQFKDADIGGLKESAVLG